MKPSIILYGLSVGSLLLFGWGKYVTHQFTKATGAIMGCQAKGCRLAGRGLVYIRRVPVAGIVGGMEIQEPDTKLISGSILIIADKTKFSILTYHICSCSYSYEALLLIM